MAHQNTTVLAHLAATGKLILSMGGDNTFPTLHMRKKMNQENGMHSMHLLGLPAEIRQQIRRYVVIEGFDIGVYAGGERLPPLLSVSSLVREEAASIYHRENGSWLFVGDYDITPVRAWYELYTLYDGERAQSPPLSISLYVQPSWTNLLNWCEAVHGDEMIGLPAPGHSHDMLATTISSMHSMVEVMRGTPWIEVKQGVLALRGIFTAIDPAWAN